MELAMDFSVDMLLPQFSKQVINCIDDAQKNMDPPYSDGLFWNEIRTVWRDRNNGVILSLLVLMFDPLFTRLLKLDGIYINQDCTKYSVKKITTVDPKSGKEDEYFIFSEGIKHKFPGYQLDSNYLVENISDSYLDKDQLITVLLSKDLEAYERFHKKELFSSVSRFISNEVGHQISYTSYPRSGNTFLRKYLENITGVATGSD